MPVMVVMMMVVVIIGWPHIDTDSDIGPRGRGESQERQRHECGDEQALEYGFHAFLSARPVPHGVDGALRTGAERHP